MSTPEQRANQREDERRYYDRWRTDYDHAACGQDGWGCAAPVADFDPECNLTTGGASLSAIAAALRYVVLVGFALVGVLATVEHFGLWPVLLIPGTGLVIACEVWQRHGGAS